MSLSSKNASLYAYRRGKNILAQVLAVAATVFGLFWLVWIVWTTLSKGIASIKSNIECASNIALRPRRQSGKFFHFGERATAHHVPRCHSPSPCKQTGRQF